MNIYVGLFLVMLSAVANAKNTTYPFLLFSDLKPYTETECPKECGDTMKFGMNLGSLIVGSVLNDASFSVSFCDECIIGGMQHFTFDYKCFRSPDEDVYDHYIDAVFPNFYINCTCTFSNNPSAMAEKINSGKGLVGECGKDKSHNTQECEPVKCEGGSGDGESTIKLNAHLGLSTLSLILRADDRAGNPGLFPIKSSLITAIDDPIIHEGPPEFDEAWKCMDENKAGIICRLFANFQTPFYDCLGKPDETTTSLLHAVLFTYARCPKY